MRKEGLQKLKFTRYSDNQRYREKTASNLTNECVHIHGKTRTGKDSWEINSKGWEMMKRLDHRRHLGT